MFYGNDELLWYLENIKREKEDDGDDRGLLHVKEVMRMVKAKIQEQARVEVKECIEAMARQGRG